MRAFAVCLLVLGACASEPKVSFPGAAWADSDRDLNEVQLAGAPLNAQAFVAEAAFLFPAESRELVRCLKRAAFAKRVAERLGLMLPPDFLAAKLAENIEVMRLGLGETSLNDWSAARYGQSWASVQAAMKARLHDQWLYQMVVRADAWLSGRVRLHILVSRDEAKAQKWASDLSYGANPRLLAGESLVVGQMPDASFSPMARYLPNPLGEWLDAAHVHEVLGPFRFQGDSAWHVVRLSEVFEPHVDLPPRSVLLDGLSSEPISPLEARAWFEEMSRRYNAHGNLPGISALSSPFVPNRPN